MYSANFKNFSVIEIEKRITMRSGNSSKNLNALRIEKPTFNNICFGPDRMRGLRTEVR